MQIRISDLSPTGLQIDDTISLDSLNDRMSEGREREIRFTEAPQVKIHVRKTASGAEVKGTVSSKYTQPCSLCLGEQPRSVKVSVDFVLKEKPEASQELFEDDVGIIYYENDHVELESTLQEALILSLSPFWHPPVDGKGKCSSCGKHMSELGVSRDAPKTSLGELLSKAGVKSSN